MPTSVNLREKLTTKSAKDAFDKVSALGARWTVIEDEEEPNKVYASPTIETKEIGGGFLRSVGNGWARTLDEAVINKEKALIEAASKPGTLVVVNAYQKDRAEFVYNAQSKKFVPYKKPAPKM